LITEEPSTVAESKNVSVSKEVEHDPEMLLGVLCKMENACRTAEPAGDRGETGGTCPHRVVGRSCGGSDTGPNGDVTGKSGGYGGLAVHYKCVFHEEQHFEMVCIGLLIHPFTIH